MDMPFIYCEETFSSFCRLHASLGDADDLESADGVDLAPWMLEKLCTYMNLLHGGHLHARELKLEITLQNALWFALLLGWQKSEIFASSLAQLA